LSSQPWRLKEQKKTGPSGLQLALIFVILVSGFLIANPSAVGEMIQL
jgi:hypothetical protein